MTYNQNTQPIQCQYAVSKGYINTVSTDTTVESPHFPIYLHIGDNCFKVQLEKDIYPIFLSRIMNSKLKPNL